MTAKWVAGILSGIISLLLCGCGKDAAPKFQKVRALGAQCNIVTGASCNPLQMPLLTGDTYDPDYLMDVPDDQTITDNTEKEDGESSVRFDTDISEVSSSTVHDLGLAGKLPTGSGHVALSGGADFRDLASKLDIYTTQKYFSLITRRYITQTKSLTPEAKTSVGSAFRDALKGLPTAPQSDAEYAQWFQFFEKFGTHYVKSVSYGGVMRMSVFVSSTVEQSEVSDRRTWSFLLGAMFDQKIGLDVHYNGSFTKEQMKEFSSYTSDVVFHAVGGDQTKMKYQDWLATVKAKPATIKTQLGSVEDFMPDSIDFKNILEKYFSSCPHTDALGICNGYGLCDFGQHSCNCNVQGAYKETDGSCYPVCQAGCNGHGTCSMGRCKCWLRNGIGFTSFDCSKPCGSHIFDAGQGVWVDKDGRKLGKSDADPTSSPTCFCKQTFDEFPEIVGLRDQPGDVVGDPDDTYFCDGTKACSMPFWPWDNCWDYKVIRCQHGDNDCPADSNYDPLPNWESPPSRPRLNGTMEAQVMV